MREYICYLDCDKDTQYSCDFNAGCIDKSLVCDGKADCKYKDDENPAICTGESRYYSTGETRYYSTGETRYNYTG